MIDETQRDLLYSIWLHHPYLLLDFLGPPVEELIRGFKELRVAGAIEVPEKGQGVQDGNDAQA